MNPDVIGQEICENLYNLKRAVYLDMLKLAKLFSSNQYQSLKRDCRKIDIEPTKFAESN